MKLFMKQTMQRNGPSAGKGKYTHIVKQRICETGRVQSFECNPLFLVLLSHLKNKPYAQIHSVKQIETTMSVFSA